MDPAEVFDEPSLRSRTIPDTGSQPGRETSGGPAWLDVCRHQTHEESEAGGQFKTTATVHTSNNADRTSRE